MSIIIGDNSKQDQQIWDAISNKLRISNIQFRNISEGKRLELAKQLMEVYFTNPTLQSPRIQSYLNQLSQKIDVDAFYRLLENPMIELRRNSALRSVSFEIFGINAREFLQQTSSHAPSQESENRSLESPKNPTGSMSFEEWANKFAEKFPDIWGALKVKFQAVPYQSLPNIKKANGLNGQILGWLELRLTRFLNVENDRCHNSIRDILLNNAHERTVKKYMAAIYTIAELDVPEASPSKKMPGLDQTIETLAQDERTQKAWKIISAQFRGRHTSPVSDKDIFFEILRNMSHHTGQKLDAIENGWKRVFFLKEPFEHTAKFISTFNKLAGIDFPSRPLSSALLNGQEEDTVPKP